MKKSRFLIAAALAALAFCASAMSVAPPGPSGGFTVAAEASASSHDVAPIAVAGIAAVQVVQASKDVNPAQVGQNDCSGCRTAMHPGCGQREPHPSMAKGKKGGGGKRCIEVSMVVTAWPDGPQKVVRLGSIDGSRFIRST